MLDLLTTGTILCTHLGPGTPFEARSRNTTHLSLIDHLVRLFESQQFNLRAATTYSTLLVTPSFTSCQSSSTGSVPPTLPILPGTTLKGGLMLCEIQAPHTATERISEFKDNTTGHEA